MSSKAASKKRKVGIQTFVFMDLETTGLLENNQVPRIIEISLVATSRQAILKNKDGALPRALHKITIPIQPSEPIPRVVARITGLTNVLVKQEKQFDDGVYNLLKLFFERLCYPVCLVAHNGHNFDYPILATEINRIGKDLFDGLLCVDSIKGFKNILSDSNNVNIANQNFSIYQKTKELLSEPQSSDILLDDEFDDALSQVVDNVQNDQPASTSMEMINNTLIGSNDENFHGNIALEVICDSTPPASSLNIKKVELPCNRAKKNEKMIKRVFLYDKPNNYALKTIYKCLYAKTPINAHSAEGDCVTLLSCIMKMPELFVDWAEKNTIAFTSYARVQI